MQSSIGLLRSIATYYANPVNSRRLKQLYATFLSSGDLYFDIGAHVGNRIRAARQLGARVVALEPNPDLAVFLRRMYGRDPSVHLSKKALGSAQGEATLYISSYNPTVSSASSSWIKLVKQDPSFGRVEWDKPVQMETTTLDALVKEFGIPSFCKLDIEGSELEALRGLSQPIPALSFEYVPRAVELARQCIGQLEQIGRYEYNWAVGESFRLQSPDWFNAWEMESLLGAELKSGRSGDIYARVPRSPGNQKQV